MPPGLLPEHKASVVLFLERVYGISEASTFLRLLENAFLPDLRAATLLDSVCVLIFQKNRKKISCFLYVHNEIMIKSILFCDFHVFFKQ